MIQGKAEEENVISIESVNEGKVKKMAWRFRRLACFCLAFLLFGAAVSAETVPESRLDSGNNARVFYEIFVGSFSDSDGDGIGDLRGIINRMDYLNDGDPDSGRSLGIEGIWLTPVFSSPSYHKYDVSDYLKIDPAFGTEADLRELALLCHARDVKLILDLPLNHSGSGNPWYRAFLQAHRRNAPQDPYYDYYTWLPSGESAPAGRRFMNVPDAGVQVEANFSDSMPELNFDSEWVRKGVLRVAEYWMERGIDGFRFDAAKYVYFGDHEKSADFWRWYVGELKKINPDVYTVAEVWDGDGITLRYQDVMDCFHFSAAQAEGLLSQTAQAGDVNRFVSVTAKYLDTVHSARPDAMNIFFLANHDMDRSAGYLPMSNGRAQVAANLYLLSPGSPFIYYGEEIGLRGSRGGENTDANRRLAMRWGDGDTVADPEGSTYQKQSTYTVQDLEQMSGSLLQYYRKLIALRKANPEIARGAYVPLSFPDTKAGGFLCEWNGSTVGVFHNTTGKTQALDLAKATDKTFSEAVFLSADPEGESSLENGILTLAPQTSAVLR